MQSRRTLILTLSLFSKGEGNPWQRVRVTEKAIRDGCVRPGSPLPARSGERIKARGACDCILSDARDSQTTSWQKAAVALAVQEAARPESINGTEVARRLCQKRGASIRAVN